MSYPEKFPVVSDETCAQWENLSNELEERLSIEKISLTQGGEPTFVPNFPFGDEWNTEAMGPEKLDFARKVAGNLLRQFYKGAMVIQTFGKQYPGEPLPRWNVVLTWKKNGDALWKSPQRLLLRDRLGKNSHEMALRVCQAISKALELNLDPYAAYEAQEQDRVAGYVLPLDFENGSWLTQKWPYSKRHKMSLFPGDSPIGLRLPLYQLQKDDLKRALTVQVRKGALEIFIPPLEIEGFEALLVCIENLATKENWKDLTFTGYRPYDPNVTLESFGLAADPGVLEANLPVCSNWKIYREHIRNLFDAAQRAGMQALKYRLNGHVFGTGGGAHIVFGGETPETSPFLRNPRLLASIIRFWQHHPSLSYAFAGPFIGPDSQHPRIDESARPKRVDMEIACQGLEEMKPDGDKLFIQVDRMVRDLLIDRVGNTHRAEICVDKMWNPEAPNGSCGLLEFRAFESVPDAEYQSLAGLFLRAILVALIQEPFSKPFKFWGDQLHDNFLLPFFLEKDLQAVCRFLKKAGIHFDFTWLNPLMNFRFPTLGEATLPDGSIIKLRQAGELFPTLGERGASRPVDVSTDRIEVMVTGRSEIMPHLRVNNIPMKLFNVGNSQWLSGVRFKKVELFPGLAPHLPAQVPLKFSLFDQKDQKIWSGTYHTWEPKGKAYSEDPLNAKLAMERRKARWRSSKKRGKASGTTPQVPKDILKLQGKHTLDLRLFHGR